MKIVHIEDVAPERMEVADGWAISEFRLPVSGSDGSATTMFHATFRPGSVHAKHVHMNCDEIVAYLGGKGVIGQGEGRAEVNGGRRRWIPQTTEHFFFNESESEVALLVGFYPNAGSVAESGYEHRGAVAADDVRRPLPSLTEGTFVRVEDIAPLESSGCSAFDQAQIRVSVGRHSGSANALVDIDVPPQAAIGRYRFNHCEQIYFVISGEGLLQTSDGEVPVRVGHVIYAAAEEFLGLRNTNSARPFALVGFWGAGSLTETGCEPL